MVVLNNVADTIVTGTITISQLLPKVTCKKILDLFRKKFCCEFITNEIAKTATVILMNDVIDSSKKIDLSKCLAGSLRVNFPESYRQIVLKPESSVGSKNESSLDSLSLIHSQYPTAQFSKELGLFYRDGFKYGQATEKVREIIASCAQPYFEGGELLLKHEIEIPEIIPEVNSVESLFIGNGQYLNSSLRFGNFEENQEIDQVEKKKASDDSMGLMLAFVFKTNNYTCGTITNFGSTGYHRRPPYEKQYEKKGDFSLVYNGPDGIFERFYRKYDTLLRNSLHVVETKLLLSQHQKQSIRPTDKININGSDFLIDSLKFSLGTKSELTESRLVTLQLYEPLDYAKKLVDIIPTLKPTGYKWVAQNEREQITKEEYEKSIYKDVGSPMIFPPLPTSEDVGKRLYVRKAAYYIDAEHAPRPVHGESWWIYTSWLEAVADKT